MWDSGDVFEDPNFVIDFAAFAEAICGLTVDEDAYGKPGGIVKLRCEASCRHYQQYTADSTS